MTVEEAELLSEQIEREGPGWKVVETESQPGSVLEDVLLIVEDPEGRVMRIGSKTEWQECRVQRAVERTG